MLLELLDQVACPRCGSSPRLWKLEGDFTQERMANGNVKCPEEHSWKVAEEVLRFDKEENDSEMEFPDRPKTGFPKIGFVSEEERGSFLREFGLFIGEYIRSSTSPLVIFGNSILLFKYIPATERKIIVVNQDESNLRQIQEMAAKKLIYKFVSVIKGSILNLIGKDINVFHSLVLEKQLDSLNDGDTALYFTKEGDETALWRGKNYSLMKETL